MGDWRDYEKISTHQHTFLHAVFVSDGADTGKGMVMDMDPVKGAIGGRIKEIRIRKGYTQERLAEKSGISPNYLSSIERGICFPRMHNLVAIINALECSADEIFCDVIDYGYHVQSDVIGEKLAALPAEERNRICRVVEFWIETYEKKTKIKSE